MAINKCIWDNIGHIAVFTRITQLVIIHKYSSNLKIKNIDYGIILIIKLTILGIKK